MNQESQSMKNLSQTKLKRMCQRASVAKKGYSNLQYEIAQQTYVFNAEFAFLAEIRVLILELVLGVKGGYGG